MEYESLISIIGSLAALGIFFDAIMEAKAKGKIS